MQDSGLTDGLEAVERVCDADEVLSVGYTAAGVIKLSFLTSGGELGGAVDQPEALSFTQQHDTWSATSLAKRLQVHKLTCFVISYTLKTQIQWSGLTFCL